MAIAVIERGQVIEGVENSTLTATELSKTKGSTRWWRRVLGFSGIDWEVELGNYALRVQTPNGRRQALEETKNVLSLASLEDGILFNRRPGEELEERVRALERRRDSLVNSKGWSVFILPRGQDNSGR